MRTSYIIIALLLCCALALVRVLGVHVHLAHEVHEDSVAVHGVDAADHDHGPVRIVSEFGDHADDHLLHAEFDVDSPDKTAGKLPSPLLLAIVVCLAVLLLIPAGHGIGWRSAYDPPPPRQRPYSLPRSQAPPRAG